MTPFPIVGSYFWVIAIGFAAVNYVLARRRIPSLVKDQPELEEGYKKYYFRSFLFSVAPWVVMGYGIKVGQVQGIWQFLRPRDGNPYVLAFWACSFGLTTVFALWVILGNGAEVLAKYPGLMNIPFKNPKYIKLMFLGMFVLGTVMFCFVFLVLDLKVPQ